MLCTYTSPAKEGYRLYARVQVNSRPVNEHSNHRRPFSVVISALFNHFSTGIYLLTELSGRGAFINLFIYALKTYCPLSQPHRVTSGLFTSQISHKFNTIQNMHINFNIQT